MSLTKDLNKCLAEMNANNWSNKISDYTMVGSIGKGSFGEVYKAIDKSDNGRDSGSESKYCAIKWIAKKCSPNVGKILTEVSIHLRLKNNNILQLFNVIEDKNYVYLVLELCFGGTLAQLIQQSVRQCKQNGFDHKFRDKCLEPVLDYHLIRTIMRQLCSGLDYLHRNAIVHRDLNLNNVLILNRLQHNSDLVIKIADFGLAIDLNSSSLQHLSAKPHREEHVIPLPMGTTICGTPGFISPEVWSQMQTVSPKSDIFSLGSILFSCIAGYTPKGGLDLSAFSPFACDLISRLLAPNPKDRPQIDDVLSHTLVVGPLTTDRLLPIRKTTKALELAIDSNGRVVLHFNKNSTTIEVSKDGLNISITGQQSNEPKIYNFYNLPQNHWKKYFYAQKFVQLVRGKTPKITVNVKNEENSNEYIVKCCLMETNDFEVTLFNTITNQTNKVLANDYNKFNETVFRQRIEDLHTFCLRTEKDLQKSQNRSGIDCFPVSFGRKTKIKADSTQTLSTQQPMLSSQVLRSIQIEGIGEASQLSNGVFNVCFTDGSSLSFRTDSEIPVIFYPRNGIEKRYKKSDILPEFVKQKLALLPQIVDKLRESQINR